MTGTLQISLEPAKPLPASDEAGLLEAALKRNPASTAVRKKLANVFNELDRFAETIALLYPSIDTLDSESALLLAQACFAMRDSTHLEMARLAAGRARLVAVNDAGQARAMADMAKSESRLGNTDKAIALLKDALALDRHCRAAFKRLAVQLMRQGDARAVEQLTDDLLAGGICHSRVLAARTVALGALGRDGEARMLAGIGQFLNRSAIAPPNTYQGSAEFHTALTAELTGSSQGRQDRYGTASVHTGRLDAPSATGSPLWTALLGDISRAIEGWANAFPPAGHPWLAARPERAVLRSWCVMTGVAGFERWHMHPDGWLSGGYYPAIPCERGPDAEKSGTIAFGLPEGLAGAEAAGRFGELVVRPDIGELLLFPSHLYHRTYPHGTAGQRICIAFDIIPV